MRPRLVLLLNLAILIVNFVLIIAASDSQERVMRATTRMACEPAALPNPYLTYLSREPPSTIDTVSASAGRGAGRGVAHGVALGIALGIALCVEGASGKSARAMLCNASRSWTS